MARNQEKVRLLCNYGGHIIYKARHKAFYYVGGETRLVSVPRKSTATYSSLSAHLSKGVYDNRPFVLKCKFPSCKLDNLVSIDNDEDVKNVMDEYDSLRASRALKRIHFFLIPGAVIAQPKTGVGSGNSGVGLDVTTKVIRISPSLVSLINKYIDEFSKDPSPSDNSCHGDESCSNATYKCPSTSSWLTDAALKDHPSIVMEEREKVISSGEEYSPSPSLMDAVMDCPSWSGSEEVTLDFGVGSGSGSADSISRGGSSMRLPNYAAMRDGDYSFQQHDIKVPLANSVVSYESDHSSVSRPSITINEQNIEYQDAKLVDTCQCTDSPHQNDRLKPEEKLRLWCSYGGRVTYDAARKDLCYVGGESRFVRVPRKSTETYSSLSAHLSKGVYDNRSFVLKCKFPSCELDTLVSIYTDEDVKNVMEVYDSLRASGHPSRIRFFLFPAVTRDLVNS